MSFNRGSIRDVSDNRHRYFCDLGLNAESGVAADMVHGTRIARVSLPDAGRGMTGPETRIPVTDALSTDASGLILTTTHADCAPIYYFDPEHKAIALVHAGWRGILAGLAGKVVRWMNDEYGSQPGRLHLAVGPTISAPHYQVQHSLAEQFSIRFGGRVVQSSNGVALLDLFVAIAADLLESGVSGERLRQSPPCTYSDPQYGSFRRDGEACSPMMAWLMLL